jgi:hypothetical protein
VRHAVGRSALHAFQFFLFKLVDQFDGGQEPDPAMVMDNRLYAVSVALRAGFPAALFGS